MFFDVIHNIYTCASTASLNKTAYIKRTQKMWPFDQTRGMGVQVETNKARVVLKIMRVYGDVNMYVCYYTSRTFCVDVCGGVCIRPLPANTSIKWSIGAD